MRNPFPTLKNGVHFNDVEMIMNRRREQIAKKTAETETKFKREQIAKKTAETETKFNTDLVFMDIFDPKEGPTRDTGHPLYFF